MRAMSSHGKSRALKVKVYIAFETLTQSQQFEKYLKSGRGDAFANKHFWSRDHVRVRSCFERRRAGDMNGVKPTFDNPNGYSLVGLRARSNLAKRCLPDAPPTDLSLIHYWRG